MLFTFSSLEKLSLQTRVRESYSTCLASERCNCTELETVFKKERKILFVTFDEIFKNSPQKFKNL